MFPNTAKQESPQRKRQNQEDRPAARRLKKERTQSGQAPASHQNIASGSGRVDELSQQVRASQPPARASNRNWASGFRGQAVMAPANKQSFTRGLEPRNATVESSEGSSGDVSCAKKDFWYKKLLGLAQKVEPKKRYYRGEKNLHESEASKDGAAAAAHSDFAKAYSSLYDESRTIEGRINENIVEVGENGVPTAEVERIETFFSDRRMDFEAMKIEEDSLMAKVYRTHQMERDTAHDAEAAAKSAQAILIDSSVMVLEYGLISLGVPPGAAETIGTKWKVALESAKTIVGDKLILQGKKVSAEEAQKIVLLQLLKESLDSLNDKILGQFLDTDITQTLVKEFGGSGPLDIIKDTIDRAFIQPNPATLTPSSESIAHAYRMAVTVKAQQTQAVLEGGWDNPGFMESVATSSLGVMNYLVSRSAKNTRL